MPGYVEGTKFLVVGPDGVPWRGSEVSRISFECQRPYQERFNNGSSMTILIASAGFS